MGKGQIISGGADGLYSVQIKYNNDRLDAMLADLAAKKTELIDTRNEKEIARNDKAAEKNTAVADLQTAVADLSALYLQKQIYTEQLITVNMELTQLRSDLSDEQDNNTIIIQSIFQIESNYPSTYETHPDYIDAQGQLSVSDSNIDSLQNAITAKEAERDQLNNDIGDLEKAIEEKEAEVAELEKAAIDLAYEVELMDQELSAINLDIAAIEKRISQLENTAPEDETISAWCADLTEDLSGVVGTVEVPGEKQVVQIQPGYEGNAAYDQDRDGQLFPTVAMTPAQAYYDFAMLPGWQKWKPTFRYGIIDSISEGGLAAVTLDASMVSTAQDLDINQAATLSGVDFEYMSCDDAAFEAGDEVLIRFDNQLFANPMIVGFKEWPQPCEMIVPYIRASASVAADGGYMVCLGDAVPLDQLNTLNAIDFDSGGHDVLTPYGGGYPAPYEYNGQLLEWQIRDYTDDAGRVWDEIPWMGTGSWDPVFYEQYSDYENGLYYKEYYISYTVTSFVREGPYNPEFCEYESTWVVGVLPGGEIFTNGYTKQWREGDVGPYNWNRYVTGGAGSRKGAVDQSSPDKYAVIYSEFDWEVYNERLTVGCTIDTTDQVFTRSEAFFKALGHTLDLDSWSDAFIQLYKIHGKYIAMFVIQTGSQYLLGSAVENGSLTVLDITGGMMVNGVLTDVITPAAGDSGLPHVGLLLMGGLYDRTQP